MKVTIEICDWQIEHIKRLISEAEPGADGKRAVVRDDTWPQWIGAASVHLKSIMDQVERPQQ